jgi:hypothetical protein
MKFCRLKDQRSIERQGKGVLESRTPRKTRKVSVTVAEIIRGREEVVSCCADQVMSLLNWMISSQIVCPSFFGDIF